MASASVARRGSDAPKDIIAQEAGARLTVRRASGQRAESESILGMRRNSANRQLARRVSTSQAANKTAKQPATPQDDGAALGSSQSVKSGTGTSRSLANGVRRIFRSRSKSQSTPSRFRADDADAISESAEDGQQNATPTDSGKAAANDTRNTQGYARRSVDSHRRSKDSTLLKNSGLFSFGRAKTPPSRPNVDWEGVEAEIRRVSVGGGGAAQEVPSSAKGKSRQIDGHPYSSWSPYDTPKVREVHLSDGLPPTSSSGPTTTVFDIVENDAAEQPSSFMPRSPPRRSSLALSESITPKRGMLELPPTSSDRNTPVDDDKEASAGDTTVLAPQSLVPSSLTKVNTNVPKMWQIADTSRPSARDDMQSSDSMLSKQRYGSSTTASIASFRTAQSFRDAETPSPRHAYGAESYDSARSLARSASSPLSDLIDHLDQQFLPSSSSTPKLIHRSVSITDRLAELRRPNVTPSPVLVRSAMPQDGVRISSRNAYLDQPRSAFADEGDDKEADERDEDESTFSRVSGPSSNSHGGKRNTFGAGDALDKAEGSTSVTPTAGRGERNDGDEQNRRDVSMYEIETSLAAVEAALRDHSVAGSLDPNPLLAHMLTPRHSARKSTGDVSAYPGEPSIQYGSGGDDYFPQPDASRMSLLQNDEEERLARVTLPPEQQHAIADAVRQVRRAISSSQLPQIPNEDESDIGRSPLAEVMLGSDTTLDNKRALDGVEMGGGPSLLELPAPPPPQVAPELQRTRSSNSHESTPIRAARNRQESMHDVEQAYARMVELVSSAAGIDLTPSPMPNMRFLARRSVQSQDDGMAATPNAEPRSSASSYLQNASPLQQRYVRERVQSAAAPMPSVLQPLSSSETPSVLRPLAPPPPPLPPIAATSSRSARQQLLRESDALSRFMGHLPDLSEEVLDSSDLRGRSSNVSLGSRGSRRAASESPPRYYQRETPKSGGDETPLYSQQHAKAHTTELVRGVNGGASSSAAGSGGGTANGTSPSHTIKTQGTTHVLDEERYRTAADGIATTYTLNRSMSEQAHEWPTRPRYMSPSSSRIPLEQQYDGVGGGAASTREARQFNASLNNGVTDDHVHRRLRAAQTSGGSSRDHYGASVGRHSPGFAPSAATYLDNAANRRSGSSRDWSGRLDELAHSINRPPSNASGTYAAFGRSHAQRGPENASMDASDAARLALLQSRISSPASSLAIVQRRHALERDSLLDMLDRTRSEAMETRARNEQLQADLHLEVTRVLELERELLRQRDREEQLATRVQALEEDLKAEQADRVRIGELLERVQRAVDEAASARVGSGARHAHEDESGTDDLEEDEVMEMVHVRDGDMGKRGTTSSPTSSSVSILQEDLLPIKRRVFDSLGSAEDDGRLGSLGARVVSASNPGVHLHPSSRGDTTRDGSESIVDAVDLLDISGEQDLYGSDAHFDRSPSLQSHASVLGLQADEHEMGWSLDEEAPPDLRSVTPPMHAYEDESIDDATDMMQSRGKDASRSRKMSSSDDGMAERARYPSVLSKRVSLPPPQRSPSRLPMLASKASATSSTAPFVHGTTGAMSKSTSETTVVPSTSSNDGKWRFPSVLSSGSARPSIAERMRESSVGGTARHVNGSGNNSSVGDSSPSLRYASQGSRTTGGDTSYTAQTVSPIGSFIPTFPSMTAAGSRRSSLGPSGRVQSPPLSPSQRQSAYGATKSKVPVGSAMRSAGGYYDTRRPIDYDPVDTSVLDALSGEDSGYS